MDTGGDHRNSIVITENEINDGQEGEFDAGEELEAQSVTESIQEEIEKEGGSMEVEKIIMEEEIEEEQVKTVSFEVRTPSGKKFMLNDVHLETTVTEIKEMIAKQDDAYTVPTIKLIKVSRLSGLICAFKHVICPISSFDDPDRQGAQRRKPDGRRGR